MPVTSPAVTATGAPASTASANRKLYSTVGVICPPPTTVPTFSTLPTTFTVAWFIVSVPSDSEAMSS